jgi:uncharacterized protein
MDQRPHNHRMATVLPRRTMGTGTARYWTLFPRIVASQLGPTLRAARYCPFSAPPPPPRNHVQSCSSAAAAASTTTIPLLLRCHLSARQQKRTFAWSGARGHDLTGDLLWQGGGGQRPKVIVTAMAPTGFDVHNAVKRVEDDNNNTPEYAQDNSGVLHMNGSILLFPWGCFLWNVHSMADLTLESLAPVILHRPKLDYLFVGHDQSKGGSGTVPRTAIENHVRPLQEALRSQGIVMECMSLSNAMGTFNILNAEDRQVAVALILNQDDK